mmetsp:Transcript_75/g.158  ORF Transcript_75/g.158 Transcript_75/m.158 type:complete len:630 (+) Transcript_75:246-2135(+)
MSVWTDAEQTLLEEGLVKFAGKINLREKWEAVASHVGSKTADECAQRYKEGQKASFKRSGRGQAHQESSWSEPQSGWDSGWKWSKNEGWTWEDAKDDGQGGWSAEDWGAKWQEAEEEDPEEGLTEEQKRALQMKREVEANRERLRRKVEQEEEERKRREAKEKAIQDEKDREVREKREAREKEFEAARQLAAEKKRQEQELIEKAKREAQRANPAFAPRQKGGGKGQTELGSWAAKANAAKKGEAMRLKKQQELERQSAAVLANIAATKPRASATTSNAAASASSSTEVPKSKATAKAKAKGKEKAKTPLEDLPSSAASASDDDNNEEDTDRGGTEEKEVEVQTAAVPKGPARRSQPIGPKPGGADHVAKSGSGAGKWWERRWWSSLEGDCPISLAPLADLSGEPFGLDAEGSSEKHYYDGRFLANYLLSSGDFIDPVNRQQLTYEECKRLDDHLARHYPKEPIEASVADTFALFQKHGVTSRDSEEVHAVQREATAILGHLFRFQTMRRPEQHHQSSRQRGREATDAHGAGGAGASASSACAAGHTGSAASSAAAPSRPPPPPDHREDEQAFPSLPGAKAKPQPKQQSSSTGKGKANTTRFGGGGGGKKGGGGKGGTFARRSAWGAPA